MFAFPQFVNGDAPFREQQESRRAILRGFTNELNHSVLLFSLGMAVLSTVICGMAPAIHAMRLDLRSRLSAAGTGSNPAAAHGKMRLPWSLLKLRSP